MKKIIFENKIIAILLCLCIACTLMLVSCNKENGESGATEADSESLEATEKSTDDGINTEFTAVSEQVTAKSETNLRTLPSVKNSEVVYTLKNGEYLTRTGISTNGYSRLVWNGQTVYAVSSYLTY